MAKILFGGPQEKERGKPSDIHNDLIKRLSQEGHEIDYVTRGDDMMAGLNIHALKEVRDRAGLETAVYDLVLYDTGLFYDQAEPARRAQLFIERVIDYLKLARAPVIVLVDEQFSVRIIEAVQQARFTPVNKPYNIDSVVSLVNEILK